MEFFTYFLHKFAIERTRKGRMRLKISLLFVIVTFMLSAVPVNSYSSSTKLSAADIKLLKIQVETNVKEKNLTHKIEIQKANSVISELKQKGVSESSIYSELLNNLGYTTDEITQGLINEFASDLDQGIEITTTESYVKSFSDGSVIELSKNDCLEEVLDYLETYSNDSREISLLSSTTSRIDGYTDVISTDGYMRIITKSTYLDPVASGGNGWYILSGTFTWLIIPDTRYIDAFSIYGQTMVLSDVYGEIYSTVNYKKRITDTSTTGTTTTTNPSYTSTKTTVDRGSNESGIFYKWDLPNNSSYSITNYGQTITHTENVTYLSYYIRVKAQRSFPTLETPFNVFTRYCHVHPVLQFTPTFGWSTDGTNGNIGVSVSIQTAWERTYYESFNYNYYKP